MKKLLMALAIALSLAGCASTEYAQYSKAQVDIATAKAASDTARYQALSNIAKDGDGAAKIAAVMALAIGNGTQAQTSQLAAPQRSDALMWASILVPGITQAYAIGRSADVAINSSNNAAATSAATTAGFVGIASQIQAPGSVTNNTLSGTGTLGSGAYGLETPVVVVPDTIINPPVVVPDVIQITPVINETPIL